MRRRITDFVNAETGEVLGSIDTFLDVLHNRDDINLATDIATRLVGYMCAPENYNKPIIVTSTIDYGDGKTMKVTATFEHLLGWTEDEEDEEAEEDEEDE